MHTARHTPSKTVIVIAGETLQVDLEFRSDTIVQGRITRQGKPMAARVMFQPTDPRVDSFGSTTSDADGYYSVSGLTDGEYRVHVTELQSYQPYETTFTLSGSSTFDIDMRGAHLRGTVVDAESGAPIPNANISLLPAREGAGPWSAMNLIAGPNGSFSFDIVAPGPYQARAQKEGFENQIIEINVTESAGDEIQFKLRKTEGVRIRIVDGRDGRLLDGYVIVEDINGQIVFDSFREEEDSDGAVRLPLANGTFRVTVGAWPYAQRTVTVTSPSPVMTVALTPGGHLSIQFSGTSPERARLIASDGRPYLASLWNRRAEFVLQTGENRVEHVPPGSYTLVILGDSGGTKSSKQVTVVEGKTTDVKL